MGKSVKYSTMYNKKYSGNGSSTLVNGLIESKDFLDGSWQGWKSNSLDILIDLDEQTKVMKVVPGFLEDHSSSISSRKNYYPFSEDRGLIFKTN